MDATPLVPFFVFAYVSRRPRSWEEGTKVPFIHRQLSRIRACAASSERTLGRRFIVTTTYRPKPFTDHPAFDRAVDFARENGTPLLVGDLAELLSKAPMARFLHCVGRLDALDIDIWDAATDRHWRNFGPDTRNAIHGMAIDRHLLGKTISLGRKKAQKPAGNIARNQAAGAKANKVRSGRTAERIRPIVDEMKAALSTGEELSPSALMHRLNELGIKGPRSDQWSLNAAKRCLQILAAETR